MSGQPETRLFWPGESRLLAAAATTDSGEQMLPNAEGQEVVAMLDRQFVPARSRLRSLPGRFVRLLAKEFAAGGLAIGQSTYCGSPPA